jgi:hypothetical protein
MKGRHFHYQPRSRITAIGPIPHADEDDDLIETWMIGQGQETRGPRARTLGRDRGNRSSRRRPGI